MESSPKKQKKDSEDLDLQQPRDKFMDITRKSNDESREINKCLELRNSQSRKERDTENRNMEGYIGGTDRPPDLATKVGLHESASDFEVARRCVRKTNLSNQESQWAISVLEAGYLQAKAGLAQAIARECEQDEIIAEKGEIIAEKGEIIAEQDEIIAEKDEIISKTIQKINHWRTVGEEFRQAVAAKEVQKENLVLLLQCMEFAKKLNEENDEEFIRFPKESLSRFQGKCSDLVYEVLRWEILDPDTGYDHDKGWGYRIETTFSNLQSALVHAIDLSIRYVKTCRDEFYTPYEEIFKSIYQNDVEYEPTSWEISNIARMDEKILILILDRFQEVLSNESQNIFCVNERKIEGESKSSETILYRVITTKGLLPVGYEFVRDHLIQRFNHTITFPQPENIFRNETEAIQYCIGENQKQLELCIQRFENCNKINLEVMYLERNSKTIVKCVQNHFKYVSNYKEHQFPTTNFSLEKLRLELKNQAALLASINKNIKDIYIISISKIEQFELT